MTDAEKRILEIYITLYIQHMRKNNSQALTDLLNFFRCVSYNKNYNPEFLYETCIENLEILEKIPTRAEIILTLDKSSNTIGFSKSILKSFGIYGINTLTKRQEQFTINHITLYPKIKKQNFHVHLLTFLTEFAIISSNLPIKFKRSTLRYAFKNKI